MLTTTIHYGLLIALAIALVFAAFTDIRRRQIDNWLNAAVALAAPAFWWSSGLSLWPDVALQVGVALAAFVLLAGLFAMKMMGGGDVKLLTALALWIQWDIFIQLLVVMAIAGGILTVIMAGYHAMRRQREKLAIPYGVAIAIGGLWVLYFNLLPAAVPAMAAAQPDFNQSGLTHRNLTCPLTKPRAITRGLFEPWIGRNLFC